MMNESSSMLLLRVLLLLRLFVFVSFSLLHVEALLHDQDVAGGGTLVKRSERRPMIEAEYGHISAAKISDGTRGPFYLQFFTLEPNSLFLPALLHAGMVFYGHTGSGRLSWTDDGDDIRRLNIRRGDVYGLKPGSVFFVESNLEPNERSLDYIQSFLKQRKTH